MKSGAVVRCRSHLLLRQLQELGVQARFGMRAATSDCRCMVRTALAPDHGSVVADPPADLLCEGSRPDVEPVTGDVFEERNYSCRHPLSAMSRCRLVDDGTDRTGGTFQACYRPRSKRGASFGTSLPMIRGPCTKTPHCATDIISQG